MITIRVKLRDVNLGRMSGDSELGSESRLLEWWSSGREEVLQFGSTADSCKKVRSGAYIVSVVDHPYLATRLPLWLTLSSYASTTPVVLALGNLNGARVNPAEQELGNCDVARVDPAKQELGNCDVARADPTEQVLGNYDVARVDPTEQELGNRDVARVDPTEQELRNCDVARVDPTEQELGNCDSDFRQGRT
ncbi:hypothetical protein BHM03_00062745 [Ensete ventricosum]|nr:hypothetical protein BHM03_00062745 [Ensete ventricosum]